MTRLLAIALLAAFAAPAFAASAGAHTPQLVMLGPVPLDFILFACVLLGIALFHHYTFQVAVSGLVVIALYKALVTGTPYGMGIAGVAGVFGHEWITLVNLFCLLMGFALLSKHFEDSHVPAVIPRYLPAGWKGGFVLLVLIFVLSSFLDNIAAALIGGTVASVVFRGKVHIGYLAAIVAASNAGGSGSVVGDTTTTMMWIDGVNPLEVLDAYIAAAVALSVFGIVAARQQDAHAPIVRESTEDVHIDWTRVGIVAFILVTAITANVVANIWYPKLIDGFPVIGATVVAAILVSAPLRRPDWSLIPASLKGTIFLLCLVSCAALMPVEKLPPASWQTTMSLGFVSSVFDNIPLTALALKQGGYDWGMLAYCVGFGGSMIWFGSSAGVAISNMYPEAKSVGQWVKHGWHVTVAYVAGFLLLLWTLGWQPHG
ncbi:MAG TPA: citrate transporter [Usitatibacteraceae bacterium]|nr:citrate transporter [Usitatibacteraceae bacterium]